jgi:hypothetical protein
LLTLRTGYPRSSLEARPKEAAELADRTAVEQIIDDPGEKLEEKLYGKVLNLSTRGMQ